MLAFAAVAAMTFSASSSAPTPVYHLYQDSLGLSHLTLTVIFAVYAFSLLAGLLTVGSISDYVGRRPVAFAALILNAAAMALFVTGGSAAVLIAARAVQGLATGAALTTLAAAILDIDRERGPIVNSITPFIGLSVGSLGAGVLVTFAPAPEQLVFAVLLVLSLLLAALVLLMPETTTPRPGALAALRPHVRVPPQARRALVLVTPLNIAGWALGGFYFSLMPSLVRETSGLTAPLVGGAVVAALTLTATMTVLAIRTWPAERILAAASPLLALGVAVSLARCPSASGGVALRRHRHRRARLRRRLLRHLPHSGAAGRADRTRRPALRLFRAELSRLQPAGDPRRRGGPAPRPRGDKLLLRRRGHPARPRVARRRSGGAPVRPAVAGRRAVRPPVGGFISVDAWALAIGKKGR